MPSILLCSLLVCTPGNTWTHTYHTYHTVTSQDPNQTKCTLLLLCGDSVSMSTQNAISHKRKAQEHNPLHSSPTTIGFYFVLECLKHGTVKSSPHMKSLGDRNLHDASSSSCSYHCPSVSGTERPLSHCRDT